MNKSWASASNSDQSPLSATRLNNVTACWHAGTKFQLSIKIECRLRLQYLFLDQGGTFRPDGILQASFRVALQLGNEQMPFLDFL